MTSKILYLADAIYEPSAVAGQPNYDTLIGICNPFAVAHAALIHAYDNAGNELPNSPISYTMQPNGAVATSFIPGNVFSTPPGPFDGHAEIEFPDGIELPATACFGGGGPNAALPTPPVNWNNWSPNLPIEGSGYPRCGPGKQFVFPYAISYTDPTMHFGPTSYTSSMKVINKGGPASLKITYTVNDFYANKGTQCTATVQLAAGQCLEELLSQLFPAILTMNPLPDGSYEGSEGWVNVQVLPNGLGIVEPANLLGILMVTSAGFGQQTSPQMGFSMSPFVVA